MNRNFIIDYLERYKKHIFKEDIIDILYKCYERALLCSNQKGKFIFAGNGASAAISSHLALDFSKQGKIRSVSFNEPSLITALSNDYGYEKWIEKAVEIYADPNDVLVLISSSGKSPNIIGAAKYAKSIGLDVITFSGFESDNPLKSIGDINLWVESTAYNIIENTHMIWGTAIIDMVVGKAEYAVS